MNLKSIIRRFSKAKILVIGDLILDEYIIGSVDRISPEAPVPVVWAKRRSFVPGGAANVAHNVRALGGKVHLVGVVGNDANGKQLVNHLKQMKIGLEGVFCESGRHTTIKTRIVAGHQQVVRVDWEHTNQISPKTSLRIARYLAGNSKSFDAVIIEDYGKGVVHGGLLQEIIQRARLQGKIITVDPKEENFQYYNGVSAITPNRKELENAVRSLKLQDTTNQFQVHSDRLKSENDIDRAAREILEYLDLDSLLVTLGEDGMRLYDGLSSVTSIPTVAQEVFDVSGAGDTVIAVFTLALACGATKLQAAHIANYAAGIVVSKLGTAVTDRKELIEKIRLNS